MKLLVFLVILFAVDAAPTQDFTSGNNIFAADIYKEIAKINKGNILISPLSAEVVLALTQSGANGKTGQEIRNTLHLPPTKEQTETALKATLSSLKGDENYSLYTANKIYVDKDLHVKEEFKNVAKDIYKAEIENVDFIQNEQAAKTINSWVEKHTENKIHDLVTSDDFDGTTAAVLINALYFKGTWEKGFSKDSTSKSKFYKTSKDVVEVDIMHVYDEYFRYCESEELNAKFLELPYKGEDISLIIALPNEKEGIRDLEGKIDKVFGRHNFQNAHVNVAIPKFKIEGQINFKEVLINLGVSEAFKSGEADFTGIAGEKGNLYISAVRQKTFIDVDEAGAEAAAATFVGISYDSGHVDLAKEFVADHPFIFYIKVKDLILFGGRVSDPN